MDPKEIIDRIVYLDYLNFVKTGDHPDIMLLGSQKVKDVILEKGVIYIVGEDNTDDFSKGYRAAVSDIQVKLRDKVVGSINKSFLGSAPVYDFQKDYNGQFKKKEAANE